MFTDSDDDHHDAPVIDAVDQPISGGAQLDLVAIRYIRELRCGDAGGIKPLAEFSGELFADAAAKLVPFLLCAGQEFKVKACQC